MFGKVNAYETLNIIWLFTKKIEKSISQTNACINKNRLEVCFGDSVSINGVYYSSSVQLSDTLQSTAGCDSVHTVFVNVNPLIL